MIDSKKENSAAPEETALNSVSTMTTMRMVLTNKRFSQSIDGLILVLGCLLVPYTHGYLQYFGLLVAAFLLIVVKILILNRLHRRVAAP